MKEESEAKTIMSGRHRNLFDYCLGPHRGGDSYKARVLENNVTKSLLNTIDLCPSLGRRFVDWLNDEHLRSRGLPLSPPDKIEVRILGGPTDYEIGDVDLTRILLGIKKHAGDYDDDTRKGKEVDGTIVGQGWLVAIESKLNGMNKRQLGAEQRRIKATATIQVLWKDVKRCFEECLDDDSGKALSEADRLFIEQFTDFLRLKGLIPFSGIRKEHYDLLLKGQAGRNNKREELRNLFKELGGELSRRLDDLYRYVGVKGLRQKDPDYVELVFQSGRSKLSSPVKVTLSANREKNEAYLEVWAHVEEKARLRSLANHIEKRGGIGKLVRKLRNDAFQGYYMGLYDEGDGWADIREYECSRITNGELTELARITRERANEKVSFGLIKRFPLETSPSDEETQLPVGSDEQLEEIAKAMRNLYPFAQFAKGAQWESIRW